MSEPGDFSEDGDDDDDGHEDVDQRPSRSAKSREATATLELGIELIDMIPSDLDLLELPSELREEIAFCQGLKKRARGRQKRLIAQLLRAEVPDEIRARIVSLGQIRVSGSARDRRAQSWVKRLLEEGDPAIQAFVEEHPDADRNRLRTLARTARGAPEATKGKRARKELLQAIKSLVE